MSFPRYPTYKPSGVEWLGEVPEHWSLKPVFGVASERDEDNKGMKEDNLLSLSYGNIVNKDINTSDGLLPESFETYQIVRPGDIVLRLTDLQNDKRSLRSALVTQTGIITSAYLTLEPERIDSKFLNYLLRAYDVSKVFYSMGGGLRQSMKYGDIKRMPLVIPAKAEQLATATFLDHETAKIDALIAEQQRLIELLQEKRQAVISHAVTNGLNPDAPMKDSGVEWLGEVPEHWEILELKHLKKVGSSITYGIVQAGPHIDEGIPYIRTSDMAGDRLWLETCQRTSAEIDQSYARSKVEAGDLVIAIRATVGKTLEVPTELHGANLTQGTAKFSPGAKVNAQFVKASFDADYCQSQIMSSAKGATFLEITLDTLRRLKLAIPPPKEQGEIVQYLAGATSGIGELLLAAEQTNGLLQERRSALISAAVTGQIDVRGLVPEAEAA
jgi:type I restriction enzyme S subunit